MVECGVIAAITLEIAAKNASFKNTLLLKCLVVSLTAEITALLRELVAFRTTAGRPEAIRACCDHIRSYLAGTPLSVRDVTLAGKPGLVVSFHPGKHHKLLLNGHLDVVEGNERQFRLEEREGRLYGRGTNDMKGSIATMLVLLRRLALKGKRPSIALLLVTDEETGGTGTRELVRRGYTGDFVIVGEQTRLRLGTKHKGTLFVKVVAYGSSSHGSRPWLGNNAIEKLWRQLRKLEEAVPQATRSNKWLPTINVTGFVSRFPPNVTPSKAEATLDIRTTEEWSNQRIKALLKRLRIKHKILFEGAMLTNRRKDAHIRAFRKLADGMLGGKRRKYVKSCGSTDARYFSARGMPTIVFGPTGAFHHTSKEYVELRALKTFYKVLQRYVEQELL